MEQVPQPLLDALQDGCRLIAPVGPTAWPWPPKLPAGVSHTDIARVAAHLRQSGGAQTLTCYSRIGGRLEATSVAPVMFVAARRRID